MAFISPLIWAISNFIDKFLISRYFKSNVGALVLYSSLIGLPVAFLIAIFKPEVLSINLTTAIFIILNSFLLIIYLLPYFKALSKADASAVSPIFQMIPVISYFLAYFVLGESLSGTQMIGSLLIISGAIGISLRFEKKNFHFKKDVFFLQLLASLLCALNLLFFKFFVIKLDFWTVSFWQYTGYVIMGLLIIAFVKSYRNGFFQSFKENKIPIVGLNVVNEVINIIAMIIFTSAILLAPLVLVEVVAGVQSLFVFLIGIGLSIFFPNLIKEDLDKRTILPKILFIILMFVGLIILNSG